MESPNNLVLSENDVLLILSALVDARNRKKNDIANIKEMTNLSLPIQASLSYHSDGLVKLEMLIQKVQKQKVTTLY